MERQVFTLKQNFKVFKVRLQLWLRGAWTDQQLKNCNVADLNKQKLRPLFSQQ